MLSSLASAPALGEFTPRACTLSPTSARCELELERAFARARNAEINASIAAVDAARSWLVMSKTHCKAADSTTPRCEAERMHELALARTHCKTADSATPRCEAERARDFAAARNAEINASMAAAKAARTRELALARTHCKSGDSTTPRCEAERARDFAAARNAEIDASMAAVAAQREREFAAARNAEINLSMAAVAAERTREFAAARNAEINASLAAVQAERALRLAMKSVRQNGLETGAISLPDTFGPVNSAPVVRKARQLGPCREAARILSPLQFSEGSAAIEPDMKPELDQIAMMARTCPAIHIEIHGHSDNAGPSQINRHLAQLRAQAAVAYLAKAGVPQRRLTAIGHSDAQPLVPNSTAENRALNRRVEVSVNDPAMQAAAQRVIWDLAELLDPAYVPPLARLSP